jgi:predicted RNA binding protein YcfA (HicA-like mRNA interferase family)
MNKSPKHLIKLLEGKGWVLKRINGSHHIYYHPERKETIPIHVHGSKDLKTGLFLAILKKVDISVDEVMGSGKGKNRK